MKLLASLFALVFGASIFFGYTYFKESSKLKNIPTGDISEITLKGTIKKGSDLTPQNSYCPSQLYIVGEDKTFQLRSPDDSQESAATLYSKFRNAEVKINAIRPSTQSDCSATKKDCSCDQFILVNDIEQLSSASSDFPLFSGTISCLPGNNECALAFLDDSGKYYILKNISDELIIEGAKLSFTGDLTQTPNSDDGIEGIIDVVEIR